MRQEGRVFNYASMQRDARERVADMSRRSYEMVMLSGAQGIPTYTPAEISAESPEKSPERVTEQPERRVSGIPAEKGGVPDADRLLILAVVLMLLRGGGERDPWLIIALLYVTL